jgi:protein-tyrosine phosphatase
MAEGILKNRIEKQGLQGIRVASAGTWGLEGEPAAKHAIRVCSDRGIDLSGHVARRLTREMIEESDLVLTMEMEHLQGVLDLEPGALAKTRMLSGYGAEDSRIDLPIRDPYGRPKQAYVKCFEELEGYVDALVVELMEESAVSS